MHRKTVDWLQIFVGFFFFHFFLKNKLCEKEMNEDLIVWGMCGGVIILITILSYITHLYFKPKETKQTISPTPTTLKWIKQLQKRTVFPGVIRSLFTSRGARVSIEETELQQQQQQ